MKTKNKSLLGLCCYLLLNCVACEAKEQTGPSSYPVYDSGAWADGTGIPDIFWLDNNRVLFRGSEESEKRKQPQGRFNLSIWDIGKSVGAYSKGVDRIQGTLGRLCYREEIVFYPLLEKDAKGNGQYKYGKLGQEKTFIRPKSAKTILDTMNCRLHDVEALMKERKGHAIRQLLDRHGYLDLGPLGGDKNNFVNFHRADGKVIELPLRKGNLWAPEQLDYVAFKDAYFISTYYYDDTHRRSSGNVWPKTVTRNVWWFYPDGRVEAVKFPDGPWVKETKPGSGYVTYNTKLYSTRDGYFLSAGEVKNTKDPGTAGAYFLRDGKLTKLIGGNFRDPTVSPDGCMVAFVHYPYADATIADDPAPITLKAVDLCPNKEEKRHGQ